MNMTDWLLDSDPTLRWQVERDLLNLPPEVWQATKQLMTEQGFASQLLSHQQNDGTWLGGAHFPKDYRPDGSGQPFTATGPSLSQLREWGVPPEALLPDTAQLLKDLRWEYDDLPFWAGEVDVCINAYTLANGAWLGIDMTQLVDWFEDHQLPDGGWNCDWVDGAEVSSFHSTLNGLIGLLAYEKWTAPDDRIRQMRRRAEQYLLDRRLMYRLSTGELLPWTLHLAYPYRHLYSVIRALDYFRSAAAFDKSLPDKALGPAINALEMMRDRDGRWYQDYRLPGQVWFEVDAPVGQPSKWLTFHALRIQKWWQQVELIERITTI